jgi:hypothetical protein
MKKIVFLLVILGILFSASFVSASVWKEVKETVKWVKHNVAEIHVSVNSNGHKTSINYYGRPNYYVTNSYYRMPSNTYYVPPQAYYPPSTYYPRGYYNVYSGYGGYSGPVVAYD